MEEERRTLVVKDAILPWVLLLCVDQSCHYGRSILPLWYYLMVLVPWKIKRVPTDRMETMGGQEMHIDRVIHRYSLIGVLLGS